MGNCEESRVLRVLNATRPWSPQSQRIKDMCCKERGCFGSSGRIRADPLKDASRDKQKTWRKTNAGCEEFGGSLRVPASR